MKQLLKMIVTQLGLFPLAELVYRLPEIVAWINNGCSGVAPPPVKRKVITSYLRKYGLKAFVESGTYYGDTLATVAIDMRVRSISIELSDEHYNAAVTRFAGRANVELLHGDSGELMADVVSGLRSPALFWLDGHFSGGSTAKGVRETPVLQELQAILQSSIRGNVILIDDVRCFDGTHDYPQLTELLAIIKAAGDIAWEISADILRLTPRGH